MTEEQVWDSSDDGRATNQHPNKCCVQLRGAGQASNLKTMNSAHHIHHVLGKASFTHGTVVCLNYPLDNLPTEMSCKCPQNRNSCAATYREERDATWDHAAEKIVDNGEKPCLPLQGGTLHLGIPWAGISYSIIHKLAVHFFRQKSISNFPSASPSEPSSSISSTLHLIHITFEDGDYWTIYYFDCDSVPHLISCQVTWHHSLQEY